ncbi:MAG: DUF362 domain-containing protein [Lentimicrobium sp.]|jgi:uncharacterized protein (DUF362 family)|nr:DUF362 domain-containing protein [Lentimicrobium sp.]
MDFLKIETFFDINNNEDRTIEVLSAVYQNITVLKEKVRKIGEGILDNENIIKGKKILLKPNWVTHDRKPDDEWSLRTHDAVILALVEILIEQNPASIIIGDAPIQGCDWNKMLSKNFINDIEVLKDKYKIPIAIKDFRRVTFNPVLNNPIKDRRPLTDYVIFDLGTNSFLDPISTENNIFRVTNYDPDRLAESHRKGIHKYCITKELFEADVVISLPKVKTHQKTGITCALKNIVGVNGDKDYLPHHRIGGTGFGGDCYPGKNIFRLWSEYILDIANRRQGSVFYKFFTYSAAILWKLTNPQKEHHLAAGWHGNDTTWRMVLDLNKISIYGKADGTISDTPQRNLYSLCDGIIGGQGNGPLEPEPLPLGILSFTNHSGLNDICMAILMGFDHKKIALLRNQKIEFSKGDFPISLNGHRITFEMLSKYAVETVPPPGWINHLK